MSVDKETLESYADEIFAKTGVSKDFTIDILEIVRKYGFTVGNVNMEDMDGLIAVSQEETIPGFQSNMVIGVDSRKSLKIKRDIIAYEFASYYLEMKKPENNGKTITMYRIDFWQNKKKRDPDADYLASLLLMPKKQFNGKQVELSRQEALEDVKISLSNFYNVPKSRVMERISATKFDHKEV